MGVAGSPAAPPCAHTHGAVVSFSGILYSIYPDLFVVVIAYAGFGTLVTVRLGRALGAQNAQQLQSEAELRYALQHVAKDLPS